MDANKRISEKQKQPTKPRIPTALAVEPHQGATPVSTNKIGAITTLTPACEVKYAGRDSPGSSFTKPIRCFNYYSNLLQFAVRHRLSDAYEIVEARRDYDSRKGGFITDDGVKISIVLPIKGGAEARIEETDIEVPVFTDEHLTSANADRKAAWYAGDRHSSPSIQITSGYQLNWTTGIIGFDLYSFYKMICFELSSSVNEYRREFRLEIGEKKSFVIGDTKVTIHNDGQYTEILTEKPSANEKLGVEV